MCAMNAVGRLVFGLVADRIGPLNTFTIASILAGLFTFLIWPFATSFAAPITGSIVGVDKIAPGLAILFIASAASAMGTPIAAAIQASTPGNAYIGIQMFIGAVYVTGGAICLIVGSEDWCSLGRTNG